MYKKYFLAVLFVAGIAQAHAQVSRLIALTKARYDGTAFMNIGDSAAYMYLGAMDTSNTGALACDSSYLYAYLPGYTNGNLSYRYYQGIDASHNIDTIISWYYDTTSTSWVNDEFAVNTFNTSNSLLTHLVMLWDAPSISWINSTYTTYTYAGLNNTLKIVQSWRTGTSSWMNISKDSFAYDVSNNMIYHLTQRWDSVGSAWVNVQQYLDSYNALNQITVALRQMWDTTGAAWRNLTNTEYDYNALNLLSNTILQRWDTVTSLFLNFSADSLLYYPTNDISVQTMLRWDTTALTWRFQTQDSYTYDAGHHMLTDTTQNWIPAGGGHFAYTRLKLYDYNSYGQVLLYTTETWSNSPPAWIYRLAGPNNTDVQFRYYYDLYPHVDTTDSVASVNTIAGGAQGMRLMPNPAADQLNVQINLAQAAPVSVAIYDMKGMIVKQWTEAAAKSYNRTISVSGLPAGIYLINAGNSTIRLSQRFVVDR